MIKTQVERNRLYGNEILDTQQLGKKIGRQTFAIYVLSVSVLLAGLGIASRLNDKPMLLDTSTGNIIADYTHVLEGYTVEERMLLAELAYKGFRRRTGNKDADAQSVNDWSRNFTQAGYNAWSNLSPRWTRPEFVQPGFVRTVQVTGIRPDLKNEYAFTIDATEKESEAGKPLANKTYNVRLTLFFTDPKVDKAMKINGVILHEEELK